MTSTKLYTFGNIMQKEGGAMAEAGENIKIMYASVKWSHGIGLEFQLVFMSWMDGWMI